MNWYLELVLTMIKKIIPLLLCLVFSSTAFATTQYYYLRVTGAGGNSGDTGTWKTVPTSDANAMSTSNFNYSGNWSTVDSTSKLDADDVVYVKGGGWGYGNDLYPRGGIALDFYEPGDYDPETMSHTIEPVCHNSIFVNVNDVIIQDGRFSHSSRSIIVGGERFAKVTGNKILRNYIDITSNYWAGIFWGFVCDSEIGYNSIKGIPYSECQSTIHPTVPTGKGIDFNAGSRNKIHHNNIRGGWHALFMGGARTWDDNLYDVDYPSATVTGTTYTADPDASYQENEISYNTIYWRCQEGISYDVSGSEGVTSVGHVLERDTVKSVNGKTVTLNHGGWAGKGNLYSGYWMTSIANSDSKYGKHSLIKSQSGASFMLAEEIDNLAAGDLVVIGMCFRHNWIHHNTFHDGGFGASSILVEGMSLENLVEDNVLPDRPYWSEQYGISLASLDGYIQAYNNVTGVYVSQPSAYNIARNNTCGGIWNHTYDKNYGPGADFTTRNNAIYDNTIYQVAPYPGKVYLRNANAYVNNSGPVNLDNAGLRGTDPTGYVSEYFSNWGKQEQPSSLKPPKGVQVNIIP